MTSRGECGDGGQGRKKLVLIVFQNCGPFDGEPQREKEPFAEGSARRTISRTLGQLDQAADR